GSQQQLWHEPVLEHVGRAPFAGDERVVAEMPPCVVGEPLVPALDLPLPANVERFGVHQEPAAGPTAAGAAKRRDIDALRTAMDGVRSAVAGALRQLGRLYDLDDLGCARVRLDVENMYARGAQPGHDEI